VLEYFDFAVDSAVCLLACVFVCVEVLKTAEQKLSKTYLARVRADIGKRVRSDPDFVSSQFPNTFKCFGSSDKKASNSYSSSSSSSSSS